MPEQNTEIEAKGVTRYSNKQAKLITKECLEGALIQLLETKGMEKITISELVKRAGVSRTAFYAHYQTKEDVLKSVLQDVIQQIDSIAIGDVRSESFWVALFAEIEKIAAPFRLLLKAGLGEQIRSEITAQTLKTVPDDPLHRYNEILWTGAIYNLLISWVTADDPEAPEVMAQICVRIVRFDL